MSAFRHPGARDHIEARLRHAFADLLPPEPDHAEELATVAALRADGWDIDVDGLRSWREPYEPDSADEWRDSLVAGLMWGITDAVSEPAPRNWRRWKFTQRVVHHLSMLGVISGSCWSSTWAGSQTMWITWTGTRNKHTGRRVWPSTVLYVRAADWGCLLRRRHWPSPHKIGFGLCAKCAPCPDCGQPAPLNHDCEVPR